jgi:hypothetical protein
MLLYDLTTDHLTVLDLHTFSCDDTEFFLLGRYDEEESVVEILLSYTILVEQLESDIDELMSLSMRYEYCEYLFCSIMLMCDENPRE